MIISENAKPTLHEFQQLMSRTDQLLNLDAQRREDYYIKRGGIPLECDVYGAICECAKGTAFENSIELVSGASFPDIVANRFYGVEVKSTSKNHWTSIGSSILESTRIPNIERIFLTFGKLGKPVEFISRPYEDCLSGIAVTHYPRYQIDMNLPKGETIFDKLGIPYDELRKMENPVAPVSRYYRSQLKSGESLWWAGDDAEAAIPPTIRLWSSLDKQEKEETIAQGYAFFPELLANGKLAKDKYNRYALWLAASKGIVNTSLRDSFSAGGQEPMMTLDGREVMMPATFGRIYKYRHMIRDIVENTPFEILNDYWGWDGDWPECRLRLWCGLAASYGQNILGPMIARSVLFNIFDIHD